MSGRKWLKKVIVCLLLIILAVVFRKDIAEGIQEIKKVSFPKIAGILGVSIGYMLIEGYIIYQMAKGYFLNITIYAGIECAYYCGFIRLISFGSGAGIGEIYYLSKLGMQSAHATGMSMIQYLLQKIAIGIMGGLSFILCFQFVDSFIGKYKVYLLLAFIITVLIGSAILILAFSKELAEIIFRFLDWAGKYDRWTEQTKKAKEQITMLQSGTKELVQNKGRLIKVLLLNFCKYLCWFLIPYILYGDSTELSLGLSIILMALAIMMAGVIPTPSGYGALDFCLLILFQSIIGTARVVSMAILYRIATTIIPALIGGILRVKQKSS